MIQNRRQICRRIECPCEAWDSPRSTSAGSRVTDEGLAHLRELKNLTHLDLSDTRVTDAGLGLRELKNLTHLDLCSTPVTSAGLAHLKGLTNLSALNLYDTYFTGAGSEELQRASPGLTIYRMYRPCSR